MSFSIKNLLNLGSRGFSMGARFLLILYLGKYFDVEELGTFGILSTSIILAYLLVGLDFYAFATREIIENKNKANAIFNQLVFYILAYVAFLPIIIYILFGNDVLEETFIIPFLLLLFNEHLGQEFFRLFTALQKPLTANIILFFRTGSWILVFLGFHYLNVLSEEQVNLFNLLLFWLAGSAFSNVISIVIVYKQFQWNDITISFSWIKSGIKVSLWFFAATVAYKIIEYSNRYIIDFYHGKEEVGYYTFFNQIASLINIVVFTLIIMQLYPELVMLAKKDKKAFQIKYQNFYRNIFTWSIISSAAASLLIYPILIYLDKQVYFDNIAVFWWLILSNILLNLSFAPHYALYAIQKDKQLFYSTLTGSVINLLANFILIPFYGASGAAAGMAIGFLFVYILKLQIKRKIFTNDQSY